MIRLRRLIITSDNVGRYADLEMSNGATIREQWRIWRRSHSSHSVMLGIYEYDDGYPDRPEVTGMGQSLEEEFFSRAGAQ